MTRRRRLLPAPAMLGAAVLAAVLVSACAGDEKKTQPCPPISIVGDAARLTRFAPGGGRDILDLDHQVEVADIFAGCALKKSKGAVNVVTVGVSPVFVVTLGAADRDRQAPFQYFVSVIGADRAILTKQVFDLEPVFPEGRSRLIISEANAPIAIDIPLGDGRGPEDFAVLVGLQLTEADLMFNRQSAGRLSSPGAP